MPIPRHITGLVAASLAMAMPVAGWTATKTTTFVVQATVISDCSIISIPNINFGNVGVMTANLDVTSTLTVSCTPGTTYTLSLDAGSVSGSNVSNRLMAQGANTLQYQLYSDSGRTQIWGNTPGTDTQSGTGTGSNAVYTIYARMPPQATPPVGVYTSTVTATIGY